MLIISIFLGNLYLIQKANLEEIDRLMELYNQWEEEKIGKKV